MGSLVVLLNKAKSNIETCNDPNDDVVNLFRVIRTAPAALAQGIMLTPFARSEYDAALDSSDEPAEQARRFLVKSWQGHGFRENGRKVGWTCDVQGRETAYGLCNWNRVPDFIHETAQRLKEVQIEHRPALEVITRFNYPNVLIYADPPYLLSTHTGKSYTHEMTDQAHVELLEVLLQHKGYVVISGYDSSMYNEYLPNWTKDQISVLAEKGIPRTEAIWMNYQPTLFDLACGEESL